MSEDIKMLCFFEILQNYTFLSKPEPAFLLFAFFKLQKKTKRIRIKSNRNKRQQLQNSVHPKVWGNLQMKCQVSKNEKESQMKSQVSNPTKDLAGGREPLVVRPPHCCFSFPAKPCHLPSCWRDLEWVLLYDLVINVRAFCACRKSPRQIRLSVFFFTKACLPKKLERFRNRTP